MVLLEGVRDEQQAVLESESAGVGDPRKVKVPDTFGEVAD